MVSANVIKISLLVVAAAAIILAIFILEKQKQENDDFFISSQNKETSPMVQKQDPVEDLLKSMVQEVKDDYAIYIKDLKNQKTYAHNSAKTFSAASIYKLAVMYAVFDKIEKGELKKTDVVSSKKSKLDQSTSGQKPDPNASPQPSENDPTISFSISEALRLMITISDNWAATLLAQKLGWANIDKFMDTEGFTQFDLVSSGSPYINAEVVGKMLERIYRKEALSPQASSEMINLLLEQKINDRIPKYLPTDIKVAHKTGELDAVRNDAGIVYGKKGDYIFVFLSQTSKPLDATEKIALLSKEFFEALEKD